MAWFGLDKWLLGQDLNAEQARGNQYDQQLQQLNQQALDSGLYSQSVFDQAQANAEAGATGNFTDQVNADFISGAQDGLSGALQAPGKAVGFLGGSLGTALGGILKNIPWWVYLGAAAWLFVWLGGLELLRGRLKRL
jgi:hypothetical protein